MVYIFNPHKLPTTLRIKVVPKAKFERIKKEISADGEVTYKIYVIAPPENGKANIAMLELLSKTLGVAKSSLTIKKGHSSRDKIITIKV